MSKEIIKIDPKEFGLEETKAQEIAAQFKPMLDKMVELEKEFNKIIALPIEDKNTAAKAKELRLKYVKVRTGTAAIHKAQKDFYLSGGRFVDGWKNAQLFASLGIEEKLESIELHLVNIEKAKKEERRLSRVAELLPYNVMEPVGLADMTEDVWSHYFNSVKQSHQLKIEAEAKAELERIAAEKAEEEERERQRLENIKLKKEAEEREAKMKAEREQQEKILTAERKKAEDERLAAAAIAKKEREEQEKKIAAERMERERAEQELAKKKQEEEEKARKEKEDAEKLAASNDQTKYDAMCAELQSVLDKYVFKSKKYIALKNTIQF